MIRPGSIMRDVAQGSWHGYIMLVLAETRVDGKQHLLIYWQDGICLNVSKRMVGQHVRNGYWKVI